MPDDRLPKKTPAQNDARPEPPAKKPPPAAATSAWTSVKVPVHVWRSLKVLVGQVTTRGISALGQELADPIECPRCGWQLPKVREEARSASEKCTSCGYEATRVTIASYGQLLGVAVDSLLRALRKAPPTVR